MDPQGTLIGLIATDGIGEEIYATAADVFPICRSITGDGVRRTVQRIAAHIPLDILEVPTGTKVFDWVVPREWNIRDAYIRDQRGKKIVDFSSSNLHVVSYSIPVRQACIAGGAQKPPPYIAGTGRPNPISNFVLR